MPLSLRSYGCPERVSVLTTSPIFSPWKRLVSESIPAGLKVVQPLATAVADIPINRLKIFPISSNSPYRDKTCFSDSSGIEKGPTTINQKFSYVTFLQKVT